MYQQEKLASQDWWETVKHRWPLLVRHFTETAAKKDCGIEIYHQMFDAQDEPDTFTLYQGTTKQLPAELQDRRVMEWEVSNNALHLYIGGITEEERKVLLYSG